MVGHGGGGDVARMIGRAVVRSTVWRVVWHLPLAVLLVVFVVAVTGLVALAGQRRRPRQCRQCRRGAHGWLDCPGTFGKYAGSYVWRKGGRR